MAGRRGESAGAHTEIAALRADRYRAFRVFGTGLAASTGVIVMVVNVIDQDRRRFG